jgi:hypothetical protein
MSEDIGNQQTTGGWMDGEEVARKIGIDSICRLWRAENQTKSISL